MGPATRRALSPWLAVGAAFAAVAALAALGIAGPAGDAKGADDAGEFPGDDDRAIAQGYLLDAPRSPEVIDEALVVAEKLRARYRIDSGNREADREVATRRVQDELIAGLEFSEEEIAATATRLGYSLDPADCANWCGNVRELASIELRREALAAFADGRDGPGRLTAVAVGEAQPEVEPAE